MRGILGLLSDLEHSSSLLNVTLADGFATIVFGLGITNLSPNPSLILYIPDFPFNLLSNGKLTKLLTLFLSIHCIFQDLKTGKILGGRHEVNGLYYLD